MILIVIAIVLAVYLLLLIISNWSAAPKFKSANSTLYTESELCDRHCRHTRGEFGCILNGSTATSNFTNYQFDNELIAADCYCLPAELLCDLQTNCRNNSNELMLECDERNASFACSAPTQFKCSTGFTSSAFFGNQSSCILMIETCDGVFDCEDRSDELNCSTKNTSTFRTN